MKVSLSCALLLTASLAQAALQSKTLTYKDGKDVLEGYYVYDDAVSGKRPGIVVIHDWMGITDITRQRADELARLGYAALAADIYGKGVRPADAKQASMLATHYKNHRLALRARAKAALNTLLDQPQVSTQTAAIGFCFGGTTALELARMGAPLMGVVTFHGGLDTPTPQDAKKIKAKVLVLHGADDPNVPPEEVAAFEKEMRDAHVDWQLISYGGAVHSFTIPSAGTDTTKGAAYNPVADRRSHQAMIDFFREIFEK
jgi:dienelactone hydrolase